MMPVARNDLNGRLLRAVLADPVCRAILDRMPGLGLTEWWLTAGAVFQNVWNALEGHPAGYGVKDYDSFAATACAVGVSRGQDSRRVYAPFGLSDTFAIHMNPNRRVAPRRVYQARVAQYRQRWPSLTADPW